MIKLMGKEIVTILWSNILFILTNEPSLIRVGVIKIVIVINCILITFSKVIACSCN